MAKYKLTSETNQLVDGTKVYRIVRLTDNLKGGWVQSESNLSQEGTCFIYDETVVYGNAKVYENAKMYGDAKVYGNAIMSKNAWAFGEACVFDNAEVSGNATVYGNAWVYGKACVFGDAWIYDYSTAKDAEVARPGEILSSARLGRPSSVYQVYNPDTKEYVTVPNPNATVNNNIKYCSHDWVTVEGFTSVYTDCSICGAKKEEVV